MNMRCPITMAFLGSLLLACSGDESMAERRNPSTSGSVTGTGGQSGTGGSDPGFGNPSATAGAAAPGAPTPSGPPPSDICEAVHVNADPQTPDMMIVLDRSGSMTEGGRWMPSVSALRRVTMELQSQIRFGLALFPDPAAGGAVRDITECLNAPDPLACLNELAAPGAACAPGGIVVQTALDNAAAIGQALDMTLPSGGTPTGETLQAVADAFAMPQVDPDAITRPKYILLVTDGQPTCPNGMGSRTTQPDVDQSNAAIDALTALGVLTYVIGYDTSGPGNEMFASVLDGFAQRGGTGDTQHRPVEDEQSLLTEMQRIAGEAVSCSFVLEQAPPSADYVLVRLDGQQINLGDADGWQLVGERNVQLMGAACETLKDGGPHSIDVEVRCEVVTPI